MTIGIKLNGIIDEVGSAEFFTAFFNTICVVLEGGRWGSRFPVFMKEFYAGRLATKSNPKARAELLVIADELGLCSPRDVVWNIEDRSIRPPWGDNISNHITSLANYFVTSTGRDLIETLTECLNAQNDEGGDILITKY